MKPLKISISVMALFALFLFSCSDDDESSISDYSKAIGYEDVDMSLIPVWDSENDTYVYVNRDGVIKIDEEYDYSASVFCDGVARVADDDNDYYYIDKSGNKLHGNYYYASYYRSGFAVVKDDYDDDYYFVDKSGDDFLNETYARAGYFANGLAPVKDKSYTREYNNSDYKYDFWYYIDKNGETLIDDHDIVEANAFFDEYAVVGVVSDRDDWDIYYGVINKKGEEVVDFEYDAVESYCTNGLLAVAERDGNYDYDWGFVNMLGDEVIDFDYAEVYPFLENYAAVTEDDNYSDREWYFIDKTGKKVNMSYDFEAVGVGFSEGLAAVKYNGSWGYVNKSGDFVINPQYESAEAFINGFAEVNTGTTYGLINSKGVMVWSKDCPITEKKESIKTKDQLRKEKTKAIEKVLFK